MNEIHWLNLKHAWPILIVSLITIGVNAQNDSINPDLLKGEWDAHWITAPDIQPKAYGVFHFRKSIDLDEIPDDFIIHVSADNRYQLFVNGESVGRGPARSNLTNWNFETYDISEYLQPGKNVIAAQVWNMGEYAPVAQISRETGFLLQGNDERVEIANSDDSWRVIKDTAYEPTATDIGAELQSYFAVGAGDEVNAEDFPWGWKEKNYDTSNWKSAEIIRTPVVPRGFGTDNKWTLTPRAIPQMEEKKQRIQKIRRVHGIENINGDLLEGDHSVEIPSNKEVTLLLDHSFETVGYPVLKVSGGEGSKIKMTYAESLFDNNGEKGNRNEIKGKTIKGFYDVFYPDGGEERSFSPLWIRAWRYLQLKIKTGNQPLTLDDIYSEFSAYPFERKASFSSIDPSLDSIWETSWRTARLSAGETYFDTPYYEQLQYEGDTRIQALITLYNSGDDRLMRKAINDFYLSLEPEGLMQGRYPSNKFQIIPPYSLYWVSMLYDYWMLSPDKSFVDNYLDAAQSILKWYEDHIDTEKGMLGPMEWWNFVDWSEGFENGVPAGADDGHSSIITLHYAYTLKQASKLFEAFERDAKASHYKELANSLSQNTYNKCFDSHKEEMANTPKKEGFSQHAGIMALLADAIPADEEEMVMKQILDDKDLDQATFYYRFYLTRAMVKAGLADQYYGHLTPWQDMLDNGLTTFAEKPDPTRSDSHGWSAAPGYDFLSVIAGIMPDAPGFREVRIEPALGRLKEVDGSMPLPGRKKDEKIKVHFQRTDDSGGLKGKINLPENMTGRFLWKGEEIELHDGEQEIKVDKS